MPTPTPSSPASALRILILQNEHQDSPAFLAHWLRSQGQGWTLCNVEVGDAVPTQADDWDAVAVLGGSLSVNDPLPYLDDARALLRGAVAAGVPVLGHCLGGQLLAQSLGAVVVDNPVPEIGWSALALADVSEALAWFGPGPTWPVFEWHSQTFALPPGATRLAHNAACGEQAFAWGPHLGMQFHIEVDAEKLGRWVADAPAPGSALAALPSVQTAEAMRADTARLLGRSQQIASHIYRRWLGLARATQAQRAARAAAAGG